MKCNCCDNDLTDKEIIWNDDLQNWELCTTCLDASLEAAFGSRPHRDDETEVLDDDFDDNYRDEISDRYHHSLVRLEDNYD